MKIVSLYPDMPMFDQLPYFGLTETFLSRSRDHCACLPKTQIERLNDKHTL